MNPVVEEQMVRSLVEEHGIEEVSMGANLLDNIVPGWAKDINLEYFDISSSTRCVLGQLYGEYSEGMQHVREYLHNPDEGIYGSEFGFDTKYYHMVMGQRVPSYQELNAAWEKEIYARR